MSNYYSVNYKPLPSDWAPPAWIAEGSDLLAPFREIAEKTKISTNGKIYNPCASHPVIKFMRSNILKCSAGIGGLIGIASELLMAPVLANNVIYTAGTAVALAAASTAILNEIGKRVFRKKKKLDEKMLQSMLQEARKNPLFEKVYVEITQQVPIKITPYAEDFREGGAAGANLRMTPSGLEIALMENTDPKDAFYFIIFELMNACQGERYYKLHTKAEQGELSREEFTLLTEYTETSTITLASEIVKYGIRNLNWHPKLNGHSSNTAKHSEDIKNGVNPFAYEWEIANYIPSKCTISHADHYRQQWDLAYKEAYLKKQLMVHSTANEIMHRTVEMNLL